MAKRQSGSSKQANQSQAGGTKSRAASKTGASHNVDAKALQQTVSFALSFGEWAVNPPMPPQTMARSINEILIEVCARNAKILACFYMQQAFNGLNDHITLYGSQMSPASLQNLYKQRDALKAAMESNGCSHL